MKYKTSLEQLKTKTMKSGQLLKAKDLNQLIWAIRQLDAKLSKIKRK